MKKKLLALLLAGTMVFGLAACGSSDSSSSEEGTEEITVDATEEEVDELEDEEEESSSSKVTFTEQTVVDDDRFTLKIDSVEDGDGSDGYTPWLTVNLSFENKTDSEVRIFNSNIYSDSEYSLITSNGVAVGCSDIDESVLAGQTISTYIIFPANSNNAEFVETIGGFTDVAIPFYVTTAAYNDYSDSDQSADVLLRETVHVYPYGEDQAVAYERGTVEGDQVILDNDQIRVISTGVEQPDSSGYGVLIFYIENKSDDIYTVAQWDLTVNGASVKYFMNDTSIPAHTSRFFYGYIEPDQLTENGITTITDASATLIVFKGALSAIDQVYEQAFTITF